MTVRLGPQLHRADKPTSLGRMGWRDHGACKGTDTTEWVPDKAEVVSAEQRATCMSCPVYDQCLAWALSGDEWGIWAATTRDERKAMRRRDRNRRHMATRRAS